jgi:hypothetical protein
MMIYKRNANQSLIMIIRVGNETTRPVGSDHAGYGLLKSLIPTRFKIYSGRIIRVRPETRGALRTTKKREPLLNSETS